MDNNKTANTKHPVIEIIRKRWSPRSFNGEPITKDKMETLLEAASWAASASNEQPWLYRYAHIGSGSFNKLWECLAPGNQPWTSKASVLMICMARKTSAATGKPNAWAQHDLGMANANLVLQACNDNIYGHMMAGFDKAKIMESFDFPEDHEPVCMMALGYLAPAEDLEEPYKSRELTERTRKDVDEIAMEL